ncbi:MAG: SLBB domain-containing protein [Nitrospiraceae bacterium]|jgi:formate dehydrogenase iron-sulfur subunit|nr:SLBB domain-containing protein [Nitrospiraceae bacterium]OQW64689.1 MAG: formate dehydrogenase [Nitrospira sp. ST-bin5]
MSRIRLYLSKDTSSCAAGAERLAEAWRSRFDVELVRTSSRGAFFLEPMVERDSPDGRLAWCQVAPADLPRILAGNGGVPVSTIPFLAKQARHTFASFGVTEPLSTAAYQAHGGLAGLRAAQQMSPAAIIQEIKTSRLRGRGGAAFPVWKKWEVAAATTADRKYVVANADEGDAGTYCDRMIMEGDPFRMIEGMLICGRAIGAQAGYVYCRQEYPTATACLHDAIQAAEAAGWLEIDGRRFSIAVVSGAGSYVCGEETALLESLEGRRGVVRARPPHPAQSGLYGRPTIVSNVLTFATIPNILARGGAWHASMGTEGSRGTAVLQLGGRVKQPGLIEIPFGLTLREVLDQFGQGMADGARLKAVQVGGPLGSLFMDAQLDIPICFDAFAKADAILGHGGIVVFDDETDMLELSRHLMAFVADESCGKCVPCRIGSLRAREILETVQAGQATETDLALLAELGDTMKATSLCGLGARAPYPVLSALEQFPVEFRSRVRS